MKAERKKLASISVAGVAFAALSLVQTATAVNIVADAKAETVIFPSNTVIKMTQSGTLTVTEPGEIEILLVGGGGGGGRHTDIRYGGGGGAGGVVHKTAFQVSVGEWEVTIGSGGAVGANGGTTTAFGLTAWGGGHGATGWGENAASGASGGGGAGRDYWNSGSSNSKGAVATLAYTNAPYCNLGYAGSDAPYATQCSGAGGGAGGPAGILTGTPDDNGTHLAKPGAAYICSITGTDVAYAGGGSGRTWGNLHEIDGGGKGSYGGGGNSNDAGGPGVLIVRFTRNSSKETVFEDATGGTVTTCRVGDKKYRVHTFAQPGQFTIPHHGHVEVLLVGGGGGGGGGDWPCYGGGGGAGGLIHKSELFLTNGVYNIVIGAGGAVGASGGKTTAFGMTAWGGGHGATGGGANAASGASGGGGAGHYKWTADVTENTKGAEANPAYTNAPYCNLGYAGCKSPYAEECSGGGGGAGGPAGTGTSDNNGTQRANPGAAYICSITGTDVAYAGGGGGRTWNNFHMIDGGGKDSYGGGGNSGGAGGSGVVIIRYQMPKHGLFVLVK